MPELPPLAYLEAFERADYMEALHNEELNALWEGDKHAMAGAFLALAQAYLDHASGNDGQARQALSDVKALASRAEGFHADALVQHAEACLEYMGMGKALPELPSVF